MKLTSEHRKALLSDLEEARNKQINNRYALKNLIEKDSKDSLIAWFEITDCLISNQIIFITNTLVANEIDY